jgi:pyridoxal 5'-phosphate synthase pdxT subunit
VVEGSAGAPIGVLALQGDVREHVAALNEIGVASRLVKRPGDLDGLVGCVLPGGESTTLSMLLESTELWEPLGTLIKDGLPVLGTCAGLVLLAREVLDGRSDQRYFGALDVVVRRNGFGRQSQSFEAKLELGDRMEGGPLPAVFIRAPIVVDCGPEVEILASIERTGDPSDTGLSKSMPVLVRQDDILASTFHPELTQDRRLHRLFANMCGY